MIFVTLQRTPCLDLLSFSVSDRPSKCCINKHTKVHILQGQYSYKATSFAVAFAALILQGPWPQRCSQRTTSSFFRCSCSHSEAVGLRRQYFMFRSKTSVLRCARIVTRWPASRRSSSSTQSVRISDTASGSVHLPNWLVLILEAMVAERDSRSRRAFAVNTCSYFVVEVLVEQVICRTLCSYSDWQTWARDLLGGLFRDFPPSFPRPRVVLQFSRSSITVAALMVSRIFTIQYFTTTKAADHIFVRQSLCLSPKTYLLVMSNFSIPLSSSNPRSPCPFKNKQPATPIVMSRKARLCSNITRICKVRPKRGQIGCGAVLIHFTSFPLAMVP